MTRGARLSSVRGLEEGGVDDRDFHELMRDSADRVANGDGDSDTVLEQLQKAVHEHAAILARQEALIRKLRDELKGVDR